MGAPISRRSSGSSSPRSPQRVAFADALVTGVSRQLTDEELWTLYDFEAHAACCHECTQPLAVAAEGKRLCNAGHTFAVEVAKLVFRRGDGHVYFRRKESSQEVRVEMPLDYPQVASLLHAIERCLKKGEKFVRPGRFAVEPVSPTSPRISARGFTEPRQTFEVRVVEPATRRGESLRRTHITDKHTSPRGSLYSSDMEELQRDHQREKRLGYNLEVREPASYTKRRSQAYFGYS